MPRPLSVIRPVQMHLSLPEDLVARMELELFDELEGKLPYGSRNDFIASLIRQHFKSIDAHEAAFRRKNPPLKDILTADSLIRLP